MFVRYAKSLNLEYIQLRTLHNRHSNPLEFTLSDCKPGYRILWVSTFLRWWKCVLWHHVVFRWLHSEKLIAAIPRVEMVAMELIFFVVKDW